MRAAERQSPGIFLINILGQHAPRLGGRILTVDAREEDGEVADVDRIFLLEMDFELSLCQRVTAEMRPGPMMLAVHDLEHSFLKLALRTCGHGHCFLFPPLDKIRTVDPITIQQSDDILNLLADISLQGKGFTTDCLLDYVLDEGFTEPIYLNASGQDPDALYKGQPNAWAIYQVREWKRVLTVSGGPGKERRVQITETP